MEIKRLDPVPDRSGVPPATPPTLVPLQLVTRPSTFPELLASSAAHGTAVHLPRAHSQDPTPTTFAELLGQVDRLAAAFLRLGLRAGDRVGLFAENRREWLLVDLALASIGAIDVPRGVDTTPTELRFLLVHSGARWLCVDDDRLAAELLRQPLPGIERVLVMQPATAIPGAIALGDLLREPVADPAALRTARNRVAPDDLLTIVYTSGTTAEPKGVMLSHRNVLTNVQQVREVLHITERDAFLSVLPAWHMYERIMDYLALATGAQLVYTDRRRIKEDLAAVRPTVFAAVPRIWEMLHDGLLQHAAKLHGLQGDLVRRGLAVARAVGSGTASLAQRCAQPLFRGLVYRKILAKFGGRLRLCVSGGGSLPRHVDELLLGLGLPLLNGYGLTETSPVAAVRRPERNAPGHIGPPLPNTRIEARRPDGTRCAVGEIGVLWIHGPQVMRGYYRNEARTAAVLAADGWFDSGDLGRVDAEGRVWITGRQKDTIVLAGGENVEPEVVEALIKTSPLIDQAVVVGQDQKVLGALLVPALEPLRAKVPEAEWQVADGLLHGAAVQRLLRAELDRLLVRENGCRPCERVGAFAVLAEPLSTENGLLTHTLKVRRHVVAERFRELVAKLFA